MPLVETLLRAAPSAPEKVIRLAVAAVSCAASTGRARADRLAVIDYSRPSTEPRLWVFDLAQGTLLFAELVAHGRNSGDKYARSFSNQEGSYESSLGLFQTLNAYDGNNGYSLRMSGLESGINDRALDRALVVHGAPYVNTQFIKVTGRLGRSQGCPAVRPEVARPLIEALKDGQYLFAYYPDDQWLRASPYLHCSAANNKDVAAAQPTGIAH